MIHIKLTPNTEEGWADKILKTNLWPINLDTWAALKASENEIFFVEDEDWDEDLSQFNDFCKHLINKSLLKEFDLAHARTLYFDLRSNFFVFNNFGLHLFFSRRDLAVNRVLIWAYAFKSSYWV